jgi:hypothetical protein
MPSSSSSSSNNSRAPSPGREHHDNHGHPKYFGGNIHSGISRNSTFRTAEYLGITDPSDGNIKAESFVVATDFAHNRCRIAYKTQVDDEISFAEIEFVNGSWGLPSKIDVYPGIMPGENFALTYDPNDPKKVLYNHQPSKNLMLMLSKQ